METKLNSYITLSATDRVSIYNWRGNCRLEIVENKQQALEISDVNTDELLRGVSYFVRNLANDSVMTETQRRILEDIRNTLVSALRVEETNNAAA